MKIELTDEDRVGMSPAEIEALTAESAGEALGAKAEGQESEHQEGEGGPTEAAQTGAAEAGAEADLDEPTENPDEPEVSTEALEAVAADEQTPRERATHYDAGDVEALKAERQAALDERKTLRAERKDIEAKYATGDINDEERTAKLDEIEGKLDDLSDKAEELVGKIARAETLEVANRQHQHDLQMRAIDALKVRARKEGFDYDKDEKAPAQFNRALGMVVNDPEFAGKDFAECVDEAHKMVLAMRGVKPEKAADKAPEKPAAKMEEKPEAKARDVPPTLSGMPAAGTAVVGDDILQKLATLEGEEAELFMANLPAAQVEKLLRH